MDKDLKRANLAALRFAAELLALEGLSEDELREIAASCDRDHIKGARLSLEFFTRLCALFPEGK